MEPGQGTKEKATSSPLLRCPRLTLVTHGVWSPWYLCAAPQEQGFEASATSHQGLNTVLRDLITPREVQVLQVSAALTERTRNKTTHAQSTPQRIYHQL